ncbi:MAG: SUMF1/EgtB/PvdO family nonheme iron enzyme [Planctomycetes bacterium]|nr:SUMF1/EgtB/PvdO family nonheme iron enzyme [Planctomycetota bacterium]
MTNVTKPLTLAGMRSCWARLRRPRRPAAPAPTASPTGVSPNPGMNADPDDAESVRRLPPRYEIVRLLGQGGMGRVYLCRDTELNAEVALKVLPAEFAATPGAIEQIRNEARVCAKLRGCPNILQLYGLEQFDGHLFLVMEYAARGSLHAMIRAAGRLSEAESRRIGAQLADGLAAAHEVAVLHCDIKPANVLIDARGEAKIADFGIARSVAEAAAMIASAAIKGSPPYIAPEVVTGDTEDFRSDVYSLGATIFELATGRPPFTGGIVEIVTAKVRRDVPPPDAHQFAPELSDAFCEVLSRCLAVDPGDRPQSAAELAVALRATLPAALPAALPLTPPLTPLVTPLVTPPTTGAVAPTPALADVPSEPTGEWMCPPPAPDSDPQPAPALGPATPTAQAIASPLPLLRATSLAAPRKPIARRGLAVAAVALAAAGALAVVALPSVSDGLPSLAAMTWGSQAEMPAGATKRAAGEPRTTVPRAKEPSPGAAAVAGPSSAATPAAGAAPSDAPADLAPPPAAVLELARSLAAPAGFLADAGRVRCEKDGAEMVVVAGGEFVMGTPDARVDADRDEKPAHRVTVRPFLLDRHEVTNDQFAAFVEATSHRTDAEVQGVGCIVQGNGWSSVHGADWRHPDGPGSTIAGRGRHPVVLVSWTDAQAYAAWAGKRLPTEAEFEFVLRGGRSECRYPWGDAAIPSPGAGNYPDLALKRAVPSWTVAEGYDDGHERTAPVASFDANAYGLFDVSGNVWEWCADFYDANRYRSNAVPAGPNGPLTGRTRVARGGAWSEGGRYLACAFRNQFLPKYHASLLGFRCARSLP